MNTRNLLLSAVSLAALAAAPAHAATRFADCLSARQAPTCLAGKALETMGGAPWSERMALLVRSGSPAEALTLARTVRPMVTLLANEHRVPSERDLAQLETVDPESAALVREGAANETAWLTFTAQHDAELMGRYLPRETIAGYVLAAAAVRGPDPFEAVEVKAALADVKDDKAMLLRAMRSLLPDPSAEAPQVAPPGAGAVLGRAETVTQPSAAFLSTLAAFAWWSGDDAGASRALSALSARPAEARASWAQNARLWAAIGRPKEAQATLDAYGSGPEKLRIQRLIGEAWLRSGEKAQAQASARAVLDQSRTDPDNWIAATRLLKASGDDAGALAAAADLAQRAEAADKAQASAALASASEGYSAIGLNDRACALARRSLAAVNSSADAQAKAWQARYGTTVAVNYFTGFDYTQDVLSVDDVKHVFRDRAGRALEDCGSSEEAAKARGRERAPAAWEALAGPLNPDASDAARLKEAAARLSGDRAALGRLADAARGAAESDDPATRAQWRSALALVLAAAGRGEDARSTYAQAVRFVDQTSVPDDQSAAAAQLAADGRGLDAELAGKSFGRRLP